MCKIPICCTSLLQGRVKTLPCRVFNKLFVKLEFVRLVLFGMIYAYQTTALVARHHPIFLPYYISYMSAINQCIAIGTSWCFADTMLYKCEQKQCNTQKHKCLVQYIQPITAKYSNKAEGKCNDIAYPICFFHTVSLLCQIQVI